MFIYHMYLSRILQITMQTERQSEGAIGVSAMHSSDEKMSFSGPLCFYHRSKLPSYLVAVPVADNSGQLMYYSFFLYFFIYFFIYLFVLLFS